MKLSKTEKYLMKQVIPCVKNYGYGWISGKLYPDLDYDVTNLKNERTIYSFELWDDQGFIGNYKVNKFDWEKSSVKVI